MVKTLLAAGADLTAQDVFFGETALHVAACSGHDRVVDALSAGGADKDALDEWGCTPLMNAVVQGKLSVVKTLLAAGADLTIQDTFGGATALHMAACSGHDWVVDALLAGGADKDALNKWGCTPLTVAAEGGHVPVVKTLLAAGADETVESADGETPADKTTCERVRQLLDRAPADRAWRRRGWLVMINSRTLKARAAGSDGGDAGARSAKRRRGLTGVGSNLLGLVMLRAAAGKVRASGGGGCDDDLVAVVSGLLALELDGVFRNVVSFL